MSNALIKQTADFLQQPKQVKFLASLLSGTEQEAARVVKTAILQVMSNPSLAKCDPLSVFRSVAQAAQLGLELGSEAYLIPYKSICTMQADYKGLMRLAISRDVAKVRGDVVYSGDRFVYEREPLSLRHVPDLEDDRGEFRLAYAVAYDSQGKQIEATVITAKEMARFQGQSRSPAWKDWPDRMRIKAAIKRCCRHLPLNTKAQRLLAIEDAADRGTFVDPEIDDLGKVIDAPTLEAGSHKIRDVDRGMGVESGEQTETIPQEPDPDLDKPRQPKQAANGKRKCGHCGGIGHNKRGCPLLKGNGGNGEQTEAERLDDARRAVHETQQEMRDEPPPPSDGDAPGWGFRG